MRILPIAYNFGITNTQVSANKKNMPVFLNNATDTVEFRGKTESKRKTYENLVIDSDDDKYQKPTIHTKDIAFLLEMGDEDFNKIITEPVAYNDKSGRKNTSTVFFYTDALATEKLLNKLNDKKAAYKILKVQKDWRGTTALHTAAFSNDALKAESICTSVSKKDLSKLEKIEDIDDTPYEAAIESGAFDVVCVLKQYLY